MFKALLANPLLQGYVTKLGGLGLVLVGLAQLAASYTGQTLPPEISTGLPALGNILLGLISFGLARKVQKVVQALERAGINVPDSIEKVVNEAAATEEGTMQGILKTVVLMVGLALAALALVPGGAQAENGLHFRYFNTSGYHGSYQQAFATPTKAAQNNGVAQDLHVGPLSFMESCTVDAAGARCVKPVELTAVFGGVMAGGTAGGATTAGGFFAGGAINVFDRLGSVGFGHNFSRGGSLINEIHWGFNFAPYLAEAAASMGLPVP